tara:strand:+ start:1259 stop:1972 length:714 start_codon:yes stop_codon:yes gene_type:complete
MNYIFVSIIVTLIIILTLSVILFLKLYKKIKSSDKENFNLIQFPSETNLKIENLINEIKKYNQELNDNLNNQYKDAKLVLRDVEDKIAPFEKVAREKNDELKEYKRGYDYSKNKSIINGVIDTIDFIQKAEKKIDIKDEELKSYFLSTKDKLIIILSNAGIETFEPELNSQSLDDHGCEVDINTKKTDDEKKNNLIYEVLRPGYKIQLTDSKIAIIRKALVKVYEFEKKDDRVKKHE